MAGLRIATDFELPLDAITETFAFLAKKGGGKTYAASVFVEEVVKAGHPAVVIDPLGVWWGLRSSATGKRAGLPVVIFGGDHADLPLAETQGRFIAEAVVEGRFPAILDLSLLTKSAARRFNADFLEALYQRNRDPLLLVVDEADLLAPQRTMPDTARVLGAMEDVVRRGRARGLGCVMITQRPAVLNKDVLSQASVLVALRMSGTHDVAAIDEWIRLHADEADARELKRSLPSLPIGTAWIWSPGWVGVLRQVKIRRRETFDSSRTPKVGEARIVPPRLADIDLPGLGARLEQAREEAEQHDPVALRRKVAALEKQLAARDQAPARIERIEVPVEVRVPVVTAEDRALLEKLVAQVDLAGAALDSVRAQLAEISGRLIQAASGVPATPTAAKSTQSTVSLRPDATTTPQDVAPPRAAAPRSSDLPPATDVATSDVQLKVGARRIVETMARHYPQWLTKAQIGALTSFRTSGGTFTTYWSAIRRARLVTDRNGGKEFQVTEAGLAYAGVDPGNPLTTAEILELWNSTLKAGARTMLDLIIEAWPEGLTREQIANLTGKAMTGGTFNTYLGVLVRNQLVIKDDGVYRAADIIVEGQQ